MARPKNPQAERVLSVRVPNSAYSRLKDRASLRGTTVSEEVRRVFLEALGDILVIELDNDSLIQDKDKNEINADSVSLIKFAEEDEYAPGDSAQRRRR